MWYKYNRLSHALPETHVPDYYVISTKGQCIVTEKGRQEEEEPKLRTGLSFQWDLLPRECDDEEGDDVVDVLPDTPIP